MVGIDFGALGAGLLDDLMEVEADPLDCGDRYDLEVLLGEGGQGAVYRAHDKTLARAVAIKIAKVPAANRFVVDESRILSQLSHPSIPRIFDQGMTPDGRAFLVMQFIAGCRFNEALIDGELNLPQRLRLVRSLSGAVQHAHQAGILHRDLKPENIIVTADGEPYVLDWGLAVTDEQRAICGSPFFAAPEQLDGQPAGPTADIYALGLLLYQAASGGQLPFERQITFAEFRQRRGRIPRIGLRQRDQNLPEALARICEKASSLSPAGRYRDVASLCRAIDSLELPAARQARRRLVVMWIASIVAAVVLGMALGPSPWQPARTVLSQAAIIEAATTSNVADEQRSTKEGDTVSGVQERSEEAPTSVTATATATDDALLTPLPSGPVTAAVLDTRDHGEPDSTSVALREDDSDDLDEQTAAQILPVLTPLPGASEATPALTAPVVPPLAPPADEAVGSLPMLVLPPTLPQQLDALPAILPLSDDGSPQLPVATLPPASLPPSDLPAADDNQLPRGLPASGWQGPSDD